LSDSEVLDDAFLQLFQTVMIDIHINSRMLSHNTDFFMILGQALSSISTGESLLVYGDLDGHVLVGDDVKECMEELDSEVITLKARCYWSFVKL